MEATPGLNTTENDYADELLPLGESVLQLETTDASPVQIQINTV